MIAMLKGRVASLGSDHLVLDVSGVGYRVFASSRVLSTATLDETLLLHVSTQVREDAIHLYGFAAVADRAAFESLLGVSQVGARTALAALSTLTTNQLAQAVAERDHAALQRIPGVGKRTAQRLIIELEGKIAADLQLPPTVNAPLRVGDALPLALAQLGFKRSEIERAQAELVRLGLDDAPTGERLQQALKFLGRGR